MENNVTPFATRYKHLLISKTNLYMTGVVLLLIFAGGYFAYMTPQRALLLFFVYCGFMIIYQALNAKFLYEDKYQIFEQEGQTALGNPIIHMPQIGRILHYLLIGVIFSVALGATDADPNAAFRGFSTMGLLYAAAYGMFNEMSLKRKKKQDDENDKG